LFVFMFFFSGGFVFGSPLFLADGGISNPPFPPSFHFWGVEGFLGTICWFLRAGMGCWFADPTHPLCFVPPRSPFVFGLGVLFLTTPECLPEPVWPKGHNNFGAVHLGSGAGGRGVHHPGFFYFFLFCLFSQDFFLTKLLFFVGCFSAFDQKTFPPRVPPPPPPPLLVVCVHDAQGKKGGALVGWVAWAGVCLFFPPWPLECQVGWHITWPVPPFVFLGPFWSSPCFTPYPAFSPYRGFWVFGFLEPPEHTLPLFHRDHPPTAFFGGG